jgi:molybdenum cofactor biosynthesis enzyme MoaA
LEDFEEILLLLSGHGCTSIVNTNGTVYSAVLCNALANGTASITCSIDAGTPATYARLKGRDCIDRVLSHLGRYAETAPQSSNSRRNSLPASWTDGWASDFPG